MRAYKQRARDAARLAREVQQLRASARMLVEANPDKTNAVGAVTALADEREERLPARARRLLADWPGLRLAYAQDEYVHAVRGKEIRTPLNHTTLSGNKVPKVSLPAWEDHGEILKFLMLENVPG